MSLFGKSLKVGALISLKEARKLEQDPKNRNYIFPSEITENGEIMCKIQLKGENKLQTRIEKKKETQPKARWNSSFEQVVISGGKYKGIDREVATRHQQDQKQYNNWQSAKKYKPEQFMR